ncbi:TetR/AcrR family transcriptional regulator [Kribbella sancticallisti]|uniref:TetR/AcrR family transcriptional regulator n=1 Tax=Kribbella sancticallisti TaxID=460087 RepID=A0ABP4PK79_9ACTN
MNAHTSGTRTRRPAHETRQHVLEVTDSLFHTQGIHATGVDQVARAAGVAPTALYRLFGSKDGLVAAYVDHADQRNRSWFEGAVASVDQGGPVAVRAVFDALAETTGADDFRGCACQLAFAEYPDPRSDAHRLSASAKRWVVNRFRELLADIDTPDTRKQQAAERLALLVEGALASAGTLGPDGPASQARALAELVLMDLT